MDRRNSYSADSNNNRAPYSNYLVLMKSISDWTEEEVEHVRKIMSDMRDRVDARRMIDQLDDQLIDLVPREWAMHQFGYRTSNSAIILTVDQCTSGRWAYSVRDDWIAFEDEADMTMFMLTYKTPDFKPARLV